jgi:hypothetical protein
MFSTLHPMDRKRIVIRQFSGNIGKGAKIGVGMTGQPAKNLVTILVTIPVAFMANMALPPAVFRTYSPYRAHRDGS